MVLGYVTLPSAYSEVELFAGPEVVSVCNPEPPNASNEAS